jgi:tetraacyldisaccharide 4'-kinase
LHPIKSILAILLSPLSAIYWVITAVRNWCYDIGIFKSTSFDIPIISVGNLAVGGSGKTPMVEYLISQLEGEYNIAALSRGYGRKTKGFLWVEPNLQPNHTGDEPLQIKTKFEYITVAVCEDRVAGVQQIIAEKPEINLIILDDAFQHRAIKPSIQLLLSTYDEPFYKDWLMPSGRLRERRVGAKRADAIVLTKCPADYNQLPWEDKPVFYSKIVYQNEGFEEPIYGFSALADNRIFEKHLSENYSLLGFQGFSDHYHFTQADIDLILKKANGATLVCTEKDWMKVKDLEKPENTKYISITNEITGTINFNSWIQNKIS